ncbi:SUKH-4 family immunity protein [Streptomyces sp. MST-110588]|uniref:SUKH-4 family immunity protein n=1 Tax=Streptomyces sp. MST-110588 TaxID=2833628 RepID=UPI001F5C43CC|nr:SUKH-4 family immunity protein [Streptomyces sp. MST-110588]
MFSPNELITFPAEELTDIAHEQSVDFLRQVGIPFRDNPWFDLPDGSPGCLKKLGECYKDLGIRWTNLPEEAGNWVVFGMIPYDDLALDVVTGAVYCLPDDRSEIYLFNKDLPSFVHFLYLLEKGKPDYDADRDEEQEDWEEAARHIEAQMREVDPKALEFSDSRWHDVLEYIVEPEIP